MKEFSFTAEQQKQFLDNRYDLNNSYIENTPEELEKMLKGEDINSEKYKNKEPSVSTIEKEMKKTIDNTTMSLEEIKAKLNE